MSMRLTPAPLLTALGFATLAGLLPTGCTPDEIDQCPVLPGDLVITEIDAHSDVEWFEIHNAGTDTVDLEGLSLIYSRVDGSARKRHIVSRSVEIPAGGYVVVGAIEDDEAEASDFIDYGYGTDGLGGTGLGNSRGHLEVSCGQTGLIDEVSYDGDAGDPTPTSSASLALDGNQAPDAIANDDPANWCPSKTEFGPGFAATPGAANDPCGAPTTCTLNGEDVEIVPPAAGEIIISELMPNPEGFPDGDAEWFELHSTASQDVHLNGLEIGLVVGEEAKDLMFAPECIVLPADGYVLIATTADPTLNGGLPEPDWTTTIGLKNSGEGSLWIGIDGEVLDAVTWTSSSGGESINLDPDFYTPEDNDNDASWCDASEAMVAAYEDSGPNFGTPRAANGECPSGPAPEGECWDEELGDYRALEPLAPGELEIVEVQADPDCDAEADGEWFELRANASGDLNGLGVDKNQDDEDWEYEVPSGDCITVNAGDHIVFARNDAGSLQDFDFVTGMGLNNSDASLLIGYDSPSAPDDQYDWAGTTAGVAQSKDQNDEWCPAVDAYGCGDLGTPGGQNPSCGVEPPTGMCTDPDTMLSRMVVTPDMGELTISEVMANPGTAGEPNNEWFELHSAIAFDLNGLQLGKDGDLSQTINDELCIEVDAGPLVFLHDGPNDCGIPVDYVYDNISLTNGGDTLNIGYADEIWDSYTWDATTDGVALSYDDQTMMWCEASSAQGCGDLGTPGAANDSCEMGMGGGDQCFDLDDNAMRAIVSPAPGELVISEFMANPSGTDSAREWFEIHALAAFDLNGLELGQDFGGGTDHTISANDCLELGPGDNALLARNDNVNDNGGLDNVTYVYSALNLTNGSGAVHVAVEGELLDEVTWAQSVSDGSSSSLDPGSLDPGANDNADGPPWCVASVPYGEGGDGSPGLDNPACN